MPHARAAALAILVVPIAGCASESGASTPATAGSARSAAAVARTSHRTVVVRAREFSFAPHTVVARAGKLKITLRNRGHLTHELILLRTNRAPGSLRVRHGRVSEAASVGEISETPAGTSATHTFRLKPGRYVMVCNVRRHYGQGMRGRLTVK
jgi:plastocyanin